MLSRRAPGTAASMLYLICSNRVIADASLHRYIVTSLHRYIVTSLHRYIVTSLHRYIVTSLHRYIVTSLHRYIVTSLHRYIVTSYGRRRDRRPARTRWPIRPRVAPKPFPPSSREGTVR